MRRAQRGERRGVVAPDYPGFGHGDWPDPKAFAYTFDHYAEIMNRFTEALGLHFALDTAADQIAQLVRGFMK